MAVVPQVVVDMGVIAGVVTAVYAAGKTPPVRWLWRQVVKDPISGWLRHNVSEVMAPLEERVASIEHEMHPNGGDGLRDQVDHLVLQLSEVRRNIGV